MSSCKRNKGMPLQAMFGAVFLCLGVSGCRLASDITHNLVFETCLFTDEVKGKVYYRILACSAWKAYQPAHPERADSADFAKGFKLGYADYLEGGGDGSSHPLPPLRYWKVRHETPEGRAATLCWLEGFQAGAAAAKASGYRQLIVVPVGKSDLPPGGSPPPMPNAPMLGVVPPAPATPVEELPVPRSLPTEPPSKGGGDDKVPAGPSLQSTSHGPNKPSERAVAPAVAEWTIEAAGAGIAPSRPFGTLSGEMGRDEGMATAPFLLPF